jgi:Flp pilus assembly protein TadD
MRPAFVLSLLLLCGSAQAAPSSLDALFAQLAKASTPDDAHPIEAKIAALFHNSGSPSVDLLMSRADAAAHASDTATAKKLIVAVTAIAPKYAQGWHSRAALEAAVNDDTGALVSLQKAVLLNPRDFAALTELGAMLEEYGDKAGALKLYRRALKLDPQLEDAARHVKALTQTVEGRDI